MEDDEFLEVEMMIKRQEKDNVDKTNNEQNER